MTIAYASGVSGGTADRSGISYRNVVALTDNCGRKVRVTFLAPSGTLVVANASIGLSDGTASETVATPQELLFSGLSGFTIAAAATITSDWIDLGAQYKIGQSLVVTVDITSGGIPFSGVGSDVAWGKTGATYNQATPSGVTNQALIYGILTVETTVVPPVFAQTPKNWKVQASPGDAQPLVIATGNANGTKIIGIVGQTSSTTDVPVKLQIRRAGNDFPIGSANVVAGAGNSSGVPSVDILANIPGIGIDGDGNKEIILRDASDSLNVSYTNPSTSKKLTITAIGVDF